MHLAMETVDILPDIHGDKVYNFFNKIDVEICVALCCMDVRSQDMKYTIILLLFAIVFKCG